MKRLFLIIAALAVLFSCVKPMTPVEEVVETPVEGPVSRRVELGAQLPPTSKVTMQEDAAALKTLWGNNDAISVIYHNGSEYVNERFILSDGEGTSSARFLNEASFLSDNTPYTICYPYRAASAEGVWAMLLGSQDGTVDQLGRLIPLVGAAASKEDSPEVSAALVILRLARGLKLFTDDTASDQPLGLTICGEAVHSNAVFNGESFSGNKGPVVFSGELTTTGGCLNQNVYLALHLTDAGRTNSKLDIRVRRGDDTYNWMLNRSATMENGQMYSIRPGTDGTHPALPPQKLKTVESTAINTLYVSTDGNDGNSGTIESPLKTLQEAFNRADAGTHIYLRGGTYKAKAWLHKSGTEENPIIISSYEGEEAIIDGDGVALGYANDGALLALIGPGTNFYDYSGAHWVTIRNLTVRNSQMIGIGIVCGSSHVTIEKCRIDNCPGPGIGVGFLGRESKDIRVFGNHVNNCAQTSREAISLRKVDGFQVYKNRVENVIKECIDAKNGSRNGVIHSNEIINAGDVGIYVDAGYDVEVSGLLSAGESVPFSRNILIYGNKVVYVSRRGTGISVASEQGNSVSDIYIYNNQVYNVSALPATVQSAGIKVAKNSDDGIHTGQIKDVYIYNNTVYNMSQQGIYVNYPTIENIVIRNNIAAYNQAGDISVKQSECDESEVIIQNNMFFNANGSTTHPGWPNYNETDPAKVFVCYLWDPTDWENTIDLHLPAGGTAIGKGTFLTAPDRDYDGKVRGASIDIGAYQY